MMHNTYIMMSVLCISSFVQSAATDVVAQFGSSSIEPQMLQSEDCFSPDKTFAFGPQLNYAMFAVSKRLKTQFDWGIISHKIADHAECDVLMGCVGIVEGSDVKTTNEIAATIKYCASQDTSWIPAKSQSSAKDLAPWRRILKRMYRHAALNHVSNSSYEEYLKIRGVSISLVWFQSSKDTRSPLEIKKKCGVALRNVIMPSTLKRDCKYLVACHPTETPLEDLAKHAKSVSASHEATILRLIPERMSAFIDQEFGEKN